MSERASERAGDGDKARNRASKRTSRAPTTKGTTIDLLWCSNCTMYSLFHRKRLRSPTWKWFDVRHRLNCLSRGSATTANSASCVSSRISSSSPRNSTSLCELVTGQYLSRPRMTTHASVQSFSTNCVTQ